MASGALRALLAAALLAAATPLDGAAECVTLEDFARGAVGEFPPDWRPRQDAGRSVYAIQVEDGRRFLRARSRGLGIQAARPAEWDLARYPVLSWTWRPVEFPAGADEREPGTNDSALAVYAVFPHAVASLRSLKYVWSAAVPAGTRLSSSAGQTQVRVIRSGTEDRGRWVEERVNLLEDYRAAFASSAPRPAGIAVLTDADDTRSRAEGHYASFRACSP